jgi:hypothetical protein
MFVDLAAFVPDGVDEDRGAEGAAVLAPIPDIRAILLARERRFDLFQDMAV